eukprot:4638695-Amphidinium_carterae.2
MLCSLGCADWQVRGSLGTDRASRPCSPCSASNVSTHIQAIWETFRSFPRRMATHTHVSGIDVGPVLRSVPTARPAVGALAEEGSCPQLPSLSRVDGV